jgi:N-methylhydantoinase A
MGAYLGSLTERLGQAGFAGRVLVVTSQGGVMDAAEVAAAPIHVVNSGPSMAPVAGRAYVELEGGGDVVVADTGGTTFDVSVVRDGRIPLARELWIGAPIIGRRAQRRGRRRQPGARR